MIGTFTIQCRDDNDPVGNGIIVILSSANVVYNEYYGLAEFNVFAEELRWNV